MAELIDSFEDGDFSSWTRESNSGSITIEVRNDKSYDGSYSLYGQGSAGFSFSKDFIHTPAPSQNPGDIYSCRVYIAQNSSENKRFQLRNSAGDNTIMDVIFRDNFNDDSTYEPQINGTGICGSACTPTDEWIKVEFEYLGNDDWEGRVYKENGTQIGSSVSVTSSDTVGSVWIGFNDDADTGAQYWDFIGKNLEGNFPPSLGAVSPPDQSENKSTNKELSIDVSDPEGEDITVKFFDNSDDSQIGSKQTVTGGSGTASVTWSNLSYSATKEWYVEATDTNGNKSTSSVFSFRTVNEPQSFDGDYVEPGELTNSEWLARTEYYSTTGLAVSSGDLQLSNIKEFYGFESGSFGSDWTQTINAQVASNRVYNGTYSAEDTGRSWDAILNPSDLSGGNQITKFEIFWQETRSQTGHTFELINSNGNREVAIGNNNPQWEIRDGDGSIQVYGGDGYDRWIRYTLTFDWANNQYSYDFQDLQTGSQRTGTRSLEKGVDVEELRINDSIWGSADSLWIDNITFDGQADSGQRIANPVDLSGVTTVSDSNITWTDSQENVTVYTAITSNEYDKPSSWNQETKDTTIDEASGDLSSKYLWIKEEFARQNGNTPILNGLTASITSEPPGQTFTANLAETVSFSGDVSTSVFEFFEVGVQENFGLNDFYSDNGVTVSGNVLAAGSGVNGAEVFIVDTSPTDSSNYVLLEEVSTDSNGFYESEKYLSREVHVIAQNPSNEDDGDESKPFVSV